MKNIIMLLIIATTIISSSCKKEVDTFPASLRFGGMGECDITYTVQDKSGEAVEKQDHVQFGGANLTYIKFNATSDFIPRIEPYNIVKQENTKLVVSYYNNDVLVLRKNFY